MADWLAAQLHQAMDTLREQRDRIESAKADLAARTASATSADHLVTVTVDAQNAVVGLKFHTAKYRTMPPEQLSRTLLEVLERARAEMAEVTLEVFGPLLDQRADLRAAMAGETPADAAFAAIWDEAPPDALRRERG
ncbi:YbaB/EbfC family nucleoid-associated protein [Crossiella cryophila]|uniref:DNA-binding protein YbaB n=1 Tax=Crossiella cryophila TaxID=43355 RepID=A0A7W7FY76_9PSEU|nr:YbaB/EbfC family nucleoid-associated protein [Crossiella cryophila]MBB4681413.1 DNA-binding protein YbaB [Crossiella cryophila]